MDASTGRQNDVFAGETRGELPPRTARALWGGSAGVVVAALGIPVSVAGAEDGRRLIAATALVLVQIVALRWQTRAPVPVLAANTVTGIAVWALLPAVTLTGALLAAQVTLCVLSATRPRRVSSGALAAMCLPVALAFGTGGGAGPAVYVLTVVLAWTLGQWRRAQQERVRAETRRAVAEERARIARDVHDVVAHTLSVMVVQAAAADDVFTERPDQARQALRAVETAARPATGTPLLPRAPAAAIADGRFHRVPVLIGHTHDEGNGWAAGIIQAGHPVTPHTWPDVVASFFPEPGGARAIVREYPVHRTDGGPVFGAVIGDANFACPTARTGGLLAARVPVWRYEFADEHAPPLTPGTPPFPLGAPHASELPYLFDLGGRPRALTAAQHRLANTMIGYWTRFARGADPNGPSSPHWPRHTVLSLAPDHVVALGTTQLHHHCAFWNGLG
ncbi:carboxylesterase family protein [Streptomyces sp. NPDC001761]